MGAPTDLTAVQLIRFLETQGVTHMFGIPGGHTLSINDALIGSAIRFVATRHEYGAVSAAASWGRITGRPGVCLATCGPGATNLATGLSAALRDSCPVVAITVNNTLRDMGWEDAQHADAVAVLSPLVKWSMQVRHPDEVSGAVAEAFRVAMSGKPGPVHLDFARDLLEKGQTAFDGPGARRESGSQRLHADPILVSELADRLAAAHRPVLWIGNGVRVSGAARRILEVAEHFACAVMTTFNGIGTVPTTHPNVFGARSRVGTRLSNPILAQSDLVVAIGNSLNGVSTSRWSLALPRLIQIDVEPARLGRRYPLELAVCGDADAVLSQLLVHDRGGLISERQKWLDGLRAERAAWLGQSLAVTSSAAGPVAPQELVAALDRFGRDDTVWCVDASNCGIWTHLLTIRDRMDYMRPVNFSNMGYALPAGIGAKLAAPDRDVVVLAGDGGIGMSLTEIETAVRLQLTLPIVVMNDCGYGNIRQEQLHKYGPRYNGVDLGDIRFDQVCRAMGGEGVRVTSAGDLDDALAQARRHRVPFLIDVVTDPAASVWDHPF
jgi:acetolactate synthase-1/2/3 large subunit